MAVGRKSLQQSSKPQRQDEICFCFFFFVAISVLIGIDTVTSVGSDTSVVLLCGQNYPAFAHAQEKGKHLSGPLPGHHFAAWEEEI